MLTPLIETSSFLFFEPLDVSELPLDKIAPVLETQFGIKPMRLVIFAHIYLESKINNNKCGSLHLKPFYYENFQAGVTPELAEDRLTVRAAKKQEKKIRELRKVSDLQKRWDKIRQKARMTTLALTPERLRGVSNLRDMEGNFIEIGRLTFDDADFD